MMIFTPKLVVGLAFDSGGVTGGALTSAFLTPLTLSIAQAVAESQGGKLSILTNGFGIISFISVTPLIAIQALGIIYNIRMKFADALAETDSFEQLEDFVLEAQEIENVKESEEGINESNTN
jgi:predicted hydrocarbon binding protein